MWRIAVNPRMLAVKWGTIPAVQPIAAAMPALLPKNRAVDTVYITPVPGIKTTTREVNRNSVLIISTYIKPDVMKKIMYVTISEELHNVYI